MTNFNKILSSHHHSLGFLQMSRSRGKRGVQSQLCFPHGQTATPPVLSSLYKSVSALSVSAVSVSAVSELWMSVFEAETDTKVLYT